MNTVNTRKLSATELESRKKDFSEQIASEIREDENIKTTITAKIEIEDNPESPRYWDNLGTMACEHNRYKLGDEKITDSDLFDDDLHPTEEAQKTHLFLPLYFYDHSGIMMKTCPFSCPWDSGQVGYIYISKETAKKEFGKDWKKKAEKQLTGEVAIYSQYLEGDVYGYTVNKHEETADGFMRDEVIDSCWGFFGIESVKEAVEEGHGKIEIELPF